MELHLCMGCMREKRIPGPCPYCGFQEEAYHPLMGYLPLYTILNGKYLIGKVLGAGGFGITYLGYDLNLKIKVAIKEYFPFRNAYRDTTKSRRISALSGNGERDYYIGLSNFLQEAQALARFWDVPGIVSVKDYFQENNTAYIVMKFIEGKTLKQILAEHGERLEPAKVFAMMEPVLESLAAVHQAGVIHQDISPQNLIVGQNGLLVLIDFGASKIFAGDVRGNTPLAYKPGYAPPEQYMNLGSSGPWIDVYALCATMYRAITGLVPVESIERMEKASEGADPLKKPSQLGIAIRPHQEEALMKGLEIDGKKRFSTVEELKRALYAPAPAPEPVKKTAFPYLKVVIPLIIAGISVFFLICVSAAWNRGNQVLKRRQRERNVLMTDIVDVDEDEEFMVFGSDIQRSEISRIIFTDTLSNKGRNCWDVSENKDGKVFAWTKPVISGYELYIGGEGGVRLNPDGDTLFAEYNHVTAIDFNDCVDASGMFYMGEMFYNCNDLEELNLEAFETSENVTLYYTFYQCESLEQLDVSSLDTSGCKEMIGTFRGCSGLTELNVSHFDTSQVENMAQMFMECGRLSYLDVSNFNTSQVTNMQEMFNNCFSLTSLDIRCFDTSQVTDMSSLFESCVNLKNLELGSLDTSQVTSFCSMFEGCENLRQLDLGSFDTSQVWDFSRMFAGCKTLTQLDVSSFNTENAIYMQSMFNNCRNLSQMDLTNFRTPEVINMSRMFALCESLEELDIRSFDTAQVTDISYMFYGCSRLKTLLLEDWDIDNVEKFDDVFTGSPWE